MKRIFYSMLSITYLATVILTLLITFNLAKSIINGYNLLYLCLFVIIWLGSYFLLETMIVGVIAFLFKGILKKV